MKMKEKYTYGSVKESEEYILPSASTVLLCIAFINRDSLESRVFFTLISVSILLFICWLGSFLIERTFTADNSTVTFGRFFKKRIEYSSINSIDLRCETRSYKKRSSHRYIKYISTVEIITFHCEDGDHSFASELIPSHEINKPSGVSPEDIENSKFSRLKRYIEDNMGVISRS